MHTCPAVFFRCQDKKERKAKIKFRLNQAPNQGVKSNARNKRKAKDGGDQLIKYWSSSKTLQSDVKYEKQRSPDIYQNTRKIGCVAATELCR